MRNVTILLAVVAMLAGTAGAAATLYEGFEYTAPGALNGQNGGTGFAGAWDADTGYNYVFSPSLDCNGFPFTPAGNRADDMRENLQAIRQLNGTNSINTSNSGTYYISGLIKTTRADPQAKIRLTSSDDRSASNVEPYVSFGISDDTFYCQMGDWGTDSTTGVVTDKTYFFVAEIITVASGDDTINLNVYEATAPPTAKPSSWTMSKSGDESGTMGYLHLHLTEGSGIDEIRMGANWGDVAVPEPATMVLLGLGGIGVLIRRRRK